MSMIEAELSELLPFWVNGTLTGPEQERVAEALQGSAALRAEVDALVALRRRMQETPVPSSPGSLGLARLMRAIEAETPRRQSRWQGTGLVAASVAMAAVLSSALTFVVMRGGGDVVYEQASGDDPGAALTVAFRPEASEGAIAALLREKGLVIVDGPSALGLYRIALPYDADPEEAVAYLVAASEVIATVEPAE